MCTCAAFLDMQPPVVLMGQLGRSKNAAHVHTYFVLPFYDHKKRYQSRRCGDDSHPGEEIYTPSGDEAIFHPEILAITKRRGTVFVHRFQLMTLETLLAVKFGGSKGGPGASVAGATGRKRGAGRWRTVVAKRASRRRVGRSGQAHIDHRAITVMINHSKTRSKRQVVDTGLALTNFASIPYWRNCTFT